MDPEGNVRCQVKFDVAGVAYPVVSPGRMIEMGYTFRLSSHKCYMSKDSRRVEIDRKGRTFVLKVRRRCCGEANCAVAPIGKDDPWRTKTTTTTW